MAVLAAAVMVGASACGGDAAASGQPSASASHGGDGKNASARPSAKPRPSGPPLQLESISPADGSTVGVAMPISIVFSHPVAESARKGIEGHLKVSTSTPVTGAWHWFSAQRVDWRPEKFWTAGTKASVNADLEGVADGNGRYGTHAYHHSFTVGQLTEATVSVPGHTMKVYRGGSLVRTLPIDAGSPQFPSWDGIMAVIDKQRSVRMTSCSVGITCDKSNPQFYDLTLPWDVHLTYSGTYVHYSTGDPFPGHGNGSHGCVHLSMADAKWFYNYVKPGDPVTITGSPRGKAAGDNGYASFSLTWSQWLNGSALGARTTSAG